jgi:hypothetical protein
MSAPGSARNAFLPGTICRQRVSFAYALACGIQTGGFGKGERTWR